MANEIVTEIRLELDKLRADLKQAQKDSEESAKKTGEAVGASIEDGLGRAFGGLKTAFLGLAATIAGAFTLKESIAAASEQERAINALNSAMAIAGTYTDIATQSIQNYGAQLQRASIYGDEVIQSGSALLVTMGKLSGEGLNRATQASLDLAAALNIDVNTAFSLVGKAASGHAGALSRYGITVLKTGDDARDFESALHQLETRFGGLAEMQTHTFSGAMAQTKNAFGDVLEEIGNIIIKSPIIITTIKFLGDQFATAAKSLEGFTRNRDLIGEMAGRTQEFGTALVTYVIAPLEFLYNVGVVVFNAITTGFQTMVFGVVSGAALLAGALAPFSEKAAEVKLSLDTFAASSGLVLENMAANTGESFNKIFEFDSATKAQEYINKMQEFVDQVTPIAQTNFAGIAEKSRAAMVPAFQSGWDFIVNGFNAAFGRVALTGDKFKADLQNKLNGAFSAFRDGFTSSFAAMGAAMVKGEDVLGAFGKAILGLFGDLALQLGQFYFLMGIANLFLNPAAAAGQIFAGLGLSVLGGALKALSGGGGAPATAVNSGGGAVASGGGVAANGGTGLAATEDKGQSFQETQRGEIGNKVNVVIQGNVFDKRETGLAIADAINEAFGSNGVSFATGNA